MTAFPGLRIETSQQREDERACLFRQDVWIGDFMATTFRLIASDYDTMADIQYELVCSITDLRARGNRLMGRRVGFVIGPIDVGAYEEITGGKLRVVAPGILEVAWYNQLILDEWTRLQRLQDEESARIDNEVREMMRRRWDRYFSMAEREKRRERTQE